MMKNDLLPLVLCCLSTVSWVLRTTDGLIFSLIEKVQKPNKRHLNRMHSGGALVCKTLSKVRFCILFLPLWDCRREQPAWRV